MSNKALVIAFSWLWVASPSMASGQDIRNLARERAQKSSSEPILLPAPPSDFAPKSIEELTKEALLVVEARLSRGESTLAGHDEDRVITDYAMVVTNVLAGELPGKNRVSIPLVVAMRGGEAVVEGIVVRETDGNFGEIVDGAEYLLFLRSSRPPVDGRYEVYNGGIFQITDGHARSLRRQPPEEVGAGRGMALANVRAQIARGRAAR